jgi:DinB superfamily
VQIRVAVENGNDNRSLAWALDYPGCFVYGPDESTVILSIPQTYLHYADWISRHTTHSWVKTNSLDIRLVEVWQCYFINDDFQIRENGIEVNAWFRDDWRPLSKLEASRGKLLLDWSREDLLAVAQPLTERQMKLHTPGVERWTIQRILQHIANAEWWYLDRLDLALWKKADLPEDPFSRLELVRKRVIEVMDELPGLQKVNGKEGEFWSPRKLLRRLLYHERDHLGHLLQILTEPQ